VQRRHDAAIEHDERPDDSLYDRRFLIDHDNHRSDNDRPWSDDDGAGSDDNGAGSDDNHGAARYEYGSAVHRGELDEHRRDHSSVFNHHRGLFIDDDGAEQLDVELEHQFDVVERDDDCQHHHDERARRGSRCFLRVALYGLRV
jgi:hypothetical protein